MKITKVHPLSGSVFSNRMWLKVQNTARIILQESKPLYSGIYCAEDASVGHRYTADPGPRGVEEFFDFFADCGNHPPPFIPEVERQILCLLFPVNKKVIAGIRRVAK